MVTLKEFIKQTLRDIREAKTEEQSFEGVRGTLEFDVATVALESGGAGMKVGVMGIGGEFGGNLTNQVASRIKFSIQTKGAISPSHPYSLAKVKIKNI